MTSEAKTLIIFETNKLRQVVEGEPSYGKFDFSFEFKQLNNFIHENGLTDYIHVAVPDIVIHELLQQKIEQYNDDCADFLAIKARLSELPDADFSQVKLPSNEFSCQDHLRPQLEEFISNSGIKLIELPDEKLDDIFRKILERAIQKEAPFKRSNKSSDIGFKDVVIWETILHYSAIQNYDKVFFLTKDSIFDNKCKNEFRTKLEKDISFQTAVPLVIGDLEEIYTDEIEHNKYVKFAYSDYFKGHINNKLKSIETIDFNNEEWVKSSVEGIVYLETYGHSDDEGEPLTIFVSKAKIIITRMQDTKEVNVVINTVVDKNMEIEDADFEIEGVSGS